MSNPDIAGGAIDSALKQVGERDKPDLLRLLIKGARIRLAELIGRDDASLYLAGQSRKTLEEDRRAGHGRRSK